MSKRGADTQRDGWSADFQSTDAPMDGPQKASAAQMAHRKIMRAKPRRPGAQPRPSGVLGAPTQPQGTASPSFATQDSIATNQVGQGGESIFGQQNRTSQSFEEPSQPNPFKFLPSVSFPPFQGSTNTEAFKPAFPVPPSSDFAFTPPAINNPFSFPNNNQSQSSGFQGSIFNIPPSAPFGASSSTASGDTGTSKAVAQPAINWGSSFGASEAQPKPQSNIFGSTSIASKPEQQPVFTFGQPSPRQQPASNPFNLNNSSIFAAKPIFHQSPAPNEPLSQSPTSTTPKPPIVQEQPTATNFFGQPATSTSQPQVVELSPRKDEDRMSTTPDSSPQAKGTAMLRPFEFLNHSTKGPENGSAQGQEEQRDVFRGISQLAAASESPTVTGQESSSSGSSSSLPAFTPFFTLKTPGNFTGFPQFPTPARNSTEQTSPTRSNKPMATPTFNMPLSEETGVAASGLFKHLNAPTPGPLLQSSTDSVPSVPALPPTSQASGEAKSRPIINESALIMPAHSSFDESEPESIFRDPMWRKFPVAPEDFTDDQREQLAIGYQLRFLDAGLQQHILKSRSFHLESESVTKFYMDLKRKILNGEGLATQSLVNNKRKASQDGNDHESLGKRTKLDTQTEPTPMDNQVNGGWLNAPARSKALLTEPASVPQVETSKLQADEEPSINNVEKSTDVGKRTLEEDAVSYPSLSAAPGSVTSNFFKNILERKNEDAASHVQRKGSEADKEADASVHPQKISNFTEIRIPDNHSPLFTNEPAPPAKPVSLSQPITRIPQQEASPNPFSATSNATKTPLFGAAAAPSFTPPKFGSAQPVNFLSQFGKIAEENAQKEKASRKNNDFDSDEDDEAEWERKDAEQQRAKKQKLDETAKSKSAAFVPGKGFTISEKQTEFQALGNTEGFSFSSSLNATAPTDTNTSVLSKKTLGVGNGHNIFGHLSDVESGAEGSKTGDADDEETASDGAVDDEGEKGDIRKVTSDESHGKHRTHDAGNPSEPLANTNPFGSQSAFAATKPTNLSPNVSETSHSAGRSIFDRISKDENGKAMREITPPPDKRDVSLVGDSLPAPSNTFKQGNLGGGTNIFGAGNSDAGANIFGQRTPETGSNLFGQRTPEAGSNLFRQRAPEAGPNLFGQPKPNAETSILEQRTSDTETNIFGQRTSKAGANIFGQRTLDAGTFVFGQRDSKAEVDLSEQQKSEARADIVEEPTSEAEHNVVGQRNLKSLNDVDKQKNSELNASSDKKSNSEAGANLFGHGESKIKANIFGQQSTSTSDKADPVPKPKPGLFSSTNSASNKSPTPLFSFTGSPGGDNTWKMDSPIKFGSSTSAPPGLTLTSPTPSKPSLGGLFGPSPVNTTSDTPVKPTSSIFSFNAGKTPAASGFGFNFGGPPTSSIGSLAAPSNVASNNTSRATSPGITTGDNSAAESNAENAEDGTEKHDQLNLADKGPGEEDEDVLFAVKAKAMLFESSKKAWAVRGVGKLRVLKHRDTSKTRVLLKQDPSGKIILNAALLGTMSYDYMQNKSVKLGVATDVGQLATWLIRTGKDEDAIELARILEANKTN